MNTDFWLLGVPVFYMIFGAPLAAACVIVRQWAVKNISFKLSLWHGMKFYFISIIALMTIGITSSQLIYWYKSISFHLL